MNVRIIQKKNQDPKKCHHLRMEMLSGIDQSEASLVSGIIGKTMLSLPRNLYLMLSLSIQKESAAGKKIYRCPQCGQIFSESEYRLYRRMFAKAEERHFNVWKLKSLFEERKLRSEDTILDSIKRGTQKYVCIVTRMVGANIQLEKDEDALYDRLIKKFY